MFSQITLTVVLGMNREAQVEWRGPPKGYCSDSAQRCVYSTQYNTLYKYSNWY